MLTVLIVSFAGGLIALFTPCSVMIIPLFAASLSTSANKQKVMVFFSLGLISALIPLVIGATIFSSIFLLHRQAISLIVGSMLLFWSVLILLQKHPNLPSPLVHLSQNSNQTSSWTLGFIAGLGSTTCIGPILGSIITLSGATGGTLPILGMIFYALGLLVPLLSVTWALRSGRASQIQLIGRSLVSIRHISYPLTDVLTVMLLLGTSYLFLFHQGSIAIIPIISRSELMQSIFRLQDSLILLQI